MSAVRVALETALAAASVGFPTAYENVPYTPTPGTAWQAVYVMFAEPDNPEIGTRYTERGVMQVNLFYPLDAGPGAAETRAETLRSAFAYGTSLTSGGVTTIIVKTPEIGPGRVEDDWYLKPVKVRFEAQRS